MTRGAIYRLDDDCLSIIFDQLTLNELLKCRKVCSWWRTMVDRLCRAKRTLMIYSSENLASIHCDIDACINLHQPKSAWINHEDFDNLIVAERLDVDFCDFLCINFPNITVLVLKLSLETEIVERFLKHMPALKSLSLMENSVRKINPSPMVPLQWNRLWPLLQQKSTLEDFHLGNTYLHDFISTHKLNLNFFKQLEELELRTDKVDFTNNDQFVDILNHLSPKIKCLNIVDVQRNVNWESLNGKDGKFQNITHLTISTNMVSTHEYSTLLDYICSSMVSLEVLDLDIDRHNVIDDIMPGVINLRALKCLAIRSTTFLFRNFSNRNNLIEGFLIPLLGISELVVNFLLLREHFKYLCMVFPSLQILRINGTQIDCHCMAPNVNISQVEERKRALYDKYPWLFHACPESVVPAMAELNTLADLKKLAVFGDYCPSNLIEELPLLTSVVSFDFSLCKNYQFKLLLHCLNQLARKRAREQFEMVICGDELNSINCQHELLTEKPDNLQIITLKPISGEMMNYCSSS